MTEAKIGEPSPRDLNRELRNIYDAIPFDSYDLELNPDFLSGFDLMIKAVGNGDLPGGQERHISIDDIYTAQSISSKEEQYLERVESEEFLALQSKLEGLLAQTSITRQARAVIGFQFEDDYVDGQRVGDLIGNATTVRFPSALLLDLKDPQGEGIFSKDSDKVKEIERELYGCFLDWAEIGSAGGNPVATAELQILHDWRLAFWEKYGESPYPNLEPKKSDNS